MNGHGPTHPAPAAAAAAAASAADGDFWPDDFSPNVFHFPPAFSSNPLATWEGEQLQMVSRLDLGHPGGREGGARRPIVAAYVACRNPAATLKKLDSVSANTRETLVVAL